MALNSQGAYDTGARRWIKEAEIKGYDWFLSGKNVLYDVNCVIHFVDRLGVDPALGPGTPSTYWTGAKHFLRTSGCMSEALGEGKVHHPLVTKALRSVKVEWSESGKSATKTKRLAIPVCVVRIARGKEVPRVVYVAVVMARGLLLRGCEYACPANGKLSQHLLSWEHISFKFQGRILMGREVCEVCADTLSIVHTSRKWQMVGYTREVPNRVRMWNEGRDASKGLWEDSGGCVVSVLQAWYIATQGWVSSTTPVCSISANDPVLSIMVLNSFLKEWAPVMGLDMAAVNSHCLRHGGISDLLDDGVDVEDVRVASGSKSVTALVPYIHPGERVAKRVSSALSKAVGGGST